MHAVIKTGGKQYRVAQGDTLRVEKLQADIGATIGFEQVLMVSDGDRITLGTPLVEGGKVSAEVVSHGRTRKIDVVKFKRRKDYQRKHGHRQHYTEIKITEIQSG